MSTPTGVRRGRRFTVATGSVIESVPATGRERQSKRAEARAAATVERQHSDSGRRRGDSFNRILQRTPRRVFNPFKQ